MCLYTFILEYDGGTFIHQINAEDVIAATKSWLTYVRSETEVPLTGDVLRSLEIEFNSYGVAPLDECRNVWCFGGDSGTGAGVTLVNIVQTDPMLVKAIPSLPT